MITQRNMRRANDKYIVEFLRNNKSDVVILPQGPFINLKGTLWTTDSNRAINLIGHYSDKILKKYFRQCSRQSELFETMRDIELKALKQFEESLAE